jgi:YidC/Oxa1 family membrane protein insertase
MLNILSTLWDTLLFHPFLNILLFLDHLFGDNLGLAVIVIAIVVRLLLIPLTKKQMETTEKMSSLKPKLEKLQKKYKHNQEKLAKEQMKLYREVGYNPIGCVGTFLPQMVILIAFINVIRAVTDGNFEGVYPFVEDLVFNGGDMVINTKFLIWDLAEDFGALADSFGYFSVKTLPYLGLAISVGLVQFFSTKFVRKVQGSPTPTPPATSKTDEDDPMSANEMQAQLTNSMTTIFPFMTAIITLNAPAVLGLYWLVQSLMMVVQYIIIDKEKSLEAINEFFSGDSDSDK